MENAKEIENRETERRKNESKKKERDESEGKERETGERGEASETERSRATALDWGRQRYPCSRKQFTRYIYIPTLFTHTLTHIWTHRLYTPIFH